MAGAASSGSASAVTGTKGGTFGVFAGIFMLAVGILALAAAMKVIETIDIPGIAKGLSTIGGLLIELFAFMFGLGKVVQSNGYQLMMAAGAIQTVALAILTLVAGIVILWLVPVDEINKGLGVMAASLIGVGAFVKFLSESKVGGMLAAGGGFVMIAAGIVMIAMSLLMIANIPQTQLLDAEMTLLGSVAVLAAVVGGLAALVTNGSILAAAGAMALMSASMLILAAGLKVLSTVDPIKAGAGILVLAGALVVLAIAASVLGAGWEIFLIGAGVMAALGAAAYVLAAALKVLGVAMEALGKGIVAIVQSLLEAIGMLYNFIALASETMFGGNAKLIEISRLRGNEAGQAYGDGMAQGVQNVDYKQAVNSSVTSLTNEMNAESAAQAPDSGANYLNLFGEGMESYMPNLEDQTAEINEMVNEQMKQFDPENGMMDQLMEQIDAKGIDLNELTGMTAEEAFSKFDLSAEEHAKSSVEKWQETYLDQWTAPGFKKSTKKTLEDTVTDVADILGDKDKAGDCGEDVSEGFADGLVRTGALSYVKTRAWELIDFTFREMKDKAKSHSPSIRARDELGKWIPVGMAQGLSRYAYVAANAGGSMMDDLFTALGNSLRDTDRLIANNLTLDPTITPLMDLSQIQNGADRINSLLGNGSFRVNGTLGSLSMANENIMASIAANLSGKDKSSERVVGAINSLKSDIKDLGDYVSKLEIRMDSGALVGSIASPMDKQLGIRAARNRRERPR